MIGKGKVAVCACRAARRDEYNPFQRSHAPSFSGLAAAVRLTLDGQRGMGARRRFRVSVAAVDVPDQGREGRRRDHVEL